MERKAGGWLLALLAALICGSAFPADIVSAGTRHEITVSAAISLKDAFEEIGKAYGSKDGSVRVLFNFGASGDLARQIELGAPVDVFASAARKDMDVLDGKGFVLRGTRSNIAANSVVLVVPAGSGIVPASFEGLSAKEIGKIAVGDPGTVPAGRYAEEVLSYFKLLPLVREKLIFQPPEVNSCLLN